MRDRKNIVKVRDRKQFGDTRLTPSFLGRSLTLGAVPIAATVIKEPLEAALRAPLPMPAKYLRSAISDLLQHLKMPSRNSMSAQECLAVPPNNVSNLDAPSISYVGNCVIHRINRCWATHFPRDPEDS